MPILLAAACAPTHDPEAVWDAWLQVQSWPTWDRDLSSAASEGPLGPGVVGRLVPRRGPEIRFVVVGWCAGRRWDCRSLLPGAQLTIEHEIIRTGTHWEIHHRAVVSGPLSRLYAWILGRSIRNGLEAAVQGLAARVTDPDRQSRHGQGRGSCAG